jgi:HEAT repeat protein
MFWRKQKGPDERKIDRFLSAMKSKDVHESLSAVSSMVTMSSHSPEVMKDYFLPMMPKLLGDKNTRVHTRAAFVLSGLISTLPELQGDLIRHTVDLLRHNVRVMRLYAAGMLGQVAADIPEQLKGCMNDILVLLGERDKLRAADAAFALGEIGYHAPALIEPLLPRMTAMLEQKPGVVFEMSYRAVTAFERACVTSPTLIKDSVPQLINIITQAKDLVISWDVSILLIQLSKTSPSIASELVLPHVESLLEDKSSLARAAAVYILGEIGIRQPNIVKKYLSKLIQLSTDTDYIVRTFLALALGRICYRSIEFAAAVSPELMKLISDRHDNVRGATAISLRYIAASSPEYAETLIPTLSAMLEDRNRITRGFAALSLRLVSEVIASEIASKIIERVADGVAEGNVHVRRGAALTLHRISHHPDPEIDREIVLEAIKLLYDKDAIVKMHAVLSISNLVSTFPELVKPQIPKILELLDDSDWKLKMQAAIALGDIAQHYQAEIRALVLPQLVQLLEHKDQRITNATALSIGKII